MLPLRGTGTTVDDPMSTEGVAKDIVTAETNLNGSTKSLVVTFVFYDRDACIALEKTRFRCRCGFC